MTRVDDTRLERLAQVPLFSACSEQDLASIAAAAEVVEVPAGHVLCTHGEVGNDFYLVLEGQAEVKRYGRKVALLGPGSSFGELALLTQLRRNATVLATQESTLLKLSQESFDALLDDVPRLAHKLLTGLARRLAEADDKATRTR